MSVIYVPARSPDDWKQFLADPEKHWKTGYSARTLAYSWQEADGFPPEIEGILNTATDARLHSSSPLLVIPEHITQIAGRGESPHNDVFVLAKANHGQLVSITIEGKVDEDFGQQNQSVHKWKQGTNDRSKANRRERLDFLLEKLNVSENAMDSVAYQLVQRTASAVVEAERFNAQFAIMIVHSFSRTDKNFDVYQHFVKAFGKEAKIGELVEISAYKDIPIYVGWAHGDEQYLER